MLRKPLFLLLAAAPPAMAETAPTFVPATHVADVAVSSTSDVRDGGRKRYDRRQLVDGRDWSPWGSRPDETKGAWIRIDFDRTEYVGGLEFVPGDARDGAAFSACGRPARLRLEMGGETRTVELRDRKFQQAVPLATPLVGRSLRIVVEGVHGRGGDGGVCLSELRLRAVPDALASRPDLAARLQTAMDLLADDQRAARGLKMLPGLGAPAVPPLLAALDGRNPNLAARAAEALGALGDPSAAPALARLAKARDAQLRAAALWALGAMRRAEHYDAIRGWYERAGGEARDRALDALARLGDPRALDVVIAELVDGTAARRASVEAHLGAFGPEAVDALRPLLDSDVPRERAAALRVVGTVDLPEARERLLAGLTDPRSEIRAAALLGLAARRDPQTRLLVADRWRSRYGDERAAAATALGAIADPDDRETLELMSDDTSMIVRVAAARALGAYGAEARPQLARLALGGPDGATARAAAEALLAGDASTAAAVRLLGSRHEEVRALGGAVVGERGGEGRAALLAAVAGGDDRVRAGAAVEVRALGPMILPALLAAAEGAPAAAQPEILRILEHMADPRGRGLARRLVAEGADLTVRRAAVTALAACSDAAAAGETLVAALDDVAVEVRLAAVEAIGRLNVAEAAPRLVPLVDGEDAGLRRAAVVALGRIRDARALDKLISRYKATRHDDRAAPLREELVVAIGRIGGRASLPALIDAMSDDDREVRAAAEEALR